MRKVLISICCLALVLGFSLTSFAGSSNSQTTGSNAVAGLTTNGPWVPIED